MPAFPRFFKLIPLLAVGVAAVWVWRGDSARRDEVISGTMEVDEVHVASRYGGRIEKLPFREGDWLKPGDVIAELDAAELQARRDLAAARLEELEKGPREAEIEAGRREWESIQAQLVFAEADAKRSEELSRQKAVSSSEAERAESVANALRKSAEAARFRYELLREGTRPEQIRQARAQLAEIEAQLAEMRIAAPAKSVLEVLSVKVGDVVPPNREIATLILPDSLWMRVYVPAPWLGRIALGQKVGLRVDGEGDREFQGEVEQINRVAEFTPRNVQTPGERMRQVFGVKLRFDNADGALRAGMSGEVRFSPLSPREEKETRR